MASNPNNREYTNGEITVFWKPDLCIHATICFVQLRSVFDPSKRPWINMEGGTTGEIIDIVKKCPTNALTFKYNKDLNQEEVKSPQEEPIGEEQVPVPVPEIMIIKGGPALVKGKFKMLDDKGQFVANANQVALCRCGATKNPPYCDGSHHTIEFEK